MADKLKILVIGSKEHKLADRCVDWLAPKDYFIGDYHRVIINVGSLTKETLTLLHKNDSERLYNICREINETVWANTKVICYTEKNIDLGIKRNFRDVVNYPTNYSWSPFSPIFTEIKGGSFEDKNEKLFSNVKEFTHYYDDKYDLFFYKCQRLSKVQPRITPILNNLAKKPIAFHVDFLELDNPRYGEAKKANSPNGIMFLPPPTEISIKEEIDRRIKELLGHEDNGHFVLPTWAESIVLSNETELKTSISTKEEQEEELKKIVIKQKKDLENLNRYKRLLTAKHLFLEDIVDETLELLGVHFDVVPGFKQDRDYKDGEDIIPVEIKGRDDRLKEEDIRQIVIRTIEPHPKQHKTQGLLIANPFCITQLDGNLVGRPQPFTKDDEEKAKAFKLCLCSTIELFKALRDQLNGQDIKASLKNALFNTVGIFNYK